MTVYLPDTNGLSVSRAAMAYVRAGIGIVPMNPRGHKSCGNLIGNAADESDRWYQHVSTDRALIDSWRQRFGSFNRLALATSPGAWGGIVLDIDRPHEVCADWWPVLEEVPFTATQPLEHPKRGHYWFMLPPGHPLVGNPKHPWGEVRCYGGGIVLAPSPNNGRKIVRSGPLPVIPTDLLESVAGCRLVGVEQINVKDFYTKYAGDSMLHKLSGLEGIHRRRLHNDNEHDAMLATITQGFIEARLGMVPARAVIDTLRPLWGKRDRSEFSRLVRDCANHVEALSPERMKTEDLKSRRSAGSDSRQYTHLSR